ncbi:DUF2306 domain-containing protein [Nocardioides mangrovicus]|uniref:DUF2306 domain-containing protein n=1 Tax=Nocardioides mangrovicus TaxID=2478913 RepID=A0A3L8P214_9ACTN|nr:DUF2306 domain-containing protein [Nocardioides mangrovicus]RLV49194.1 DUF2306 domain-containing protein [Nocardioides mangrovicus]
MTESAGPAAPRYLRPLTAGVGVLLLVIVGFAVVRVVTDWPHILDGTVPADDFAKRYVAHPWFGYLHIVPGLVYLLGAPLQLSRRFRTRHYLLHRRLGRVLVGCGVLSGLLALVMGVLYPWGHATESAATVVFGTWFVGCLLRALWAIRHDDVPIHRRWMIRAFAAATGIGTIRLWVGIFTAIVLATTDVETFPERVTFGIAFWLGLSINVAVGEWWLRRTPDLDG